MRNPFPTKKSPLTRLGKVIAAAELIELVASGLGEKEANAEMRQRVGLNWGLLTACQYLTGQQAMSSIAALPDDWSVDGISKARVLAAAGVANYVCANLTGDAVASAGILVKQYREAQPL
ncbi:hypothetical protein [Luteimonas sp. MC1750]|uniref:hypothetical protein n=1 Tax=Luteimonas sp. MC1750 TaxID=2799326 RepID=UPI0018F0AC9D|nr:hypothetical protein [Luteimonas sp. MC1750]